MVIDRVTVDGYKNLEEVDIELSPNMNIICGENAQGKTNLIESIWLCTGCRSFRGTRERDFIGFEKQKADILLSFSNSERSQTISLEMKKRALKEKKIKLNGVPMPYVSSLFGHMRCVVFTPEDLELTKGSPDNRRSFLDMSVSQIKTSYISTLKKYNLTLSQRNSILRNMGGDVRSVDSSYLSVWDEQLAAYGTQIVMQRYRHCQSLKSKATDVYNEISERKEDFDIRYRSTVFPDIDSVIGNPEEMKNLYLAKMKDAFSGDVRSGFTNYGIHRDDMEIFINKLPVREFASQGQARSSALALKFAQAKILEEKFGDSPIMLLDDVLSELDPSRQKYIIDHTDSMQVIITCCDSRTVTDMKNGKIFRMEKGRIV